MVIPLSLFRVAVNGLGILSFSMCLFELHIVFVNFSVDEQASKP